jgi:hypothetical protein
MASKDLPFTLYKSHTAGKRYDVIVPNPLTGRTRRVAFGAKDYSNYTLHHDQERREQYRSRHRHDHINDPFKPGFWSWHVLWGDSTDLDKCMSTAVELAKSLLKDMEKAPKK